MATLCVCVYVAVQLEEVYISTFGFAPYTPSPDHRHLVSLYTAEVMFPPGNSPMYASMSPDVQRPIERDLSSAVPNVV